MRITIDEYKLNLFCICLRCDKYKGTREDFTKQCEAYKRKLPPEIWNGKNAECPYFEEKLQENI